MVLTTNYIDMKENSKLGSWGVTYYEYWDGDIDADILTTAVQRLVDRGMGASLGNTMYSLMKDLGVYIAQERGHKNKPIDTIIHCDWQDGQPMPHQIIEELKKHFYMVRTSSNTYWFPNGVTKTQAINWLADDMRGTMENPL